MNTPMTTSNETLEYDVGENESPADVTIPAPETDAAHAAAGSSAAAADTSVAGELDSISDSVKRRIAKLTARMRESERREHAALAYAQGLQRQAGELQQRLIHTDAGRLTEAKSRIDTQIATLKSIIKRAREENDVDTETNASQQLARLTFEQHQVEAYMPQAAAMPQPAPAPQQMPVAQPQPRAQPQPQPRRSDPKADAWASRNPWFGSDQQMTYAAFSVHKSLVDEEGFDPQGDEYYTELDRRMRKQFPDKLQSPQSRSTVHAPAVAPASRSSGVNTARKVVRLSPSEVAIANKLGVPLEEYAKYVKR